MIIPHGSRRRVDWRPLVAAQAQARLDFAELFSTPLRAPMLLVLVCNYPYFRFRLTPDEQTRGTAMSAAFEKIWRDRGVTCITAGNNLKASNYFDRTHLTASGGEKLAQIVAALVRALNRP